MRSARSTCVKRRFLRRSRILSPSSSPAREISLKGLCVSISEAARLLGWPEEEAKAALAARDVEVVATCSGKGLELEEVVAKAVSWGHIWKINLRPLSSHDLKAWRSGA